jgi:hypothetical protein
VSELWFRKQHKGKWHWCYNPHPEGQAYRSCTRSCGVIHWRKDSETTVNPPVEDRCKCCARRGK